MKVNVKKSYVVKPSEPTWSGLLSLSEFDQIGTMMHVEAFYFYTPTPSTSLDAIIHTLRLSLSQVLVHFYPLAGRLSWSGSTLALNCNAGGVLLIEAESDAVLADLGDFSPGPVFKHLVPSVDYDDPIQDILLFLGQLTKFRCGGISLGIAVSHVVADGQGISHFLSEWANLASGKPLRFAPFHDRRVLRLRAGGDQSSPQGGRRRVFHYPYPPPPLIVGQSSDESERMKKTKISMLRLSKPQIDALKAAAASNNGKPHRGYTRYEVITAHIWRCACKARKHKPPQQATNLWLCVDIRRRMEPPLPSWYFGNATIDVVIHGVSGEIISMPLQDVASKIREAIDGVTSEYVNCAIQDLYYNNEGDDEDVIIKRRQELLRPFFPGNPNLNVISWASLPILGLDFGWGKEIHMSPGSQEFDGDVLILPGGGIHGDGSLLVTACFQVDHIQYFNQYFYEDIVGKHSKI